MPLGPYKDWSSCISAQRKKGHSEESAKKICGYLEKKSKGEITENEYARILTEIWLEEHKNGKEENVN